MRRVFVDDKLQKQYEKTGYVVVDALSANDVTELLKIYTEQKVSDQPGIELSIWSDDIELKKRISDKASNVIFGKAGKYMNNYRAFYSGYVAKHSGKPNVSNLHKDPTLVDESQFRTFGMWCPLVDVNRQNGAVHVVLNSHKILDGYRGFTTLEYDFVPVTDEVMNNYGTIAEMKAGQVLIYDNALLHYSFENVTDKPRIACNCIIVPSESQTLHLHHNKELNTLDTYEIDGDFMAQYYPKYLFKEIPDRTLLNRVPFKEPIPVTMEMFKKEYERVNPSNFFTRLFKRNVAKAV